MEKKVLLCLSCAERIEIKMTGVDDIYTHRPLTPALNAHTDLLLLVN